MQIKSIWTHLHDVCSFYSHHGSRVKQNRVGQQEDHMAKTPSKSEVTSKKVATAASKVLRDPKSSAAAKSAAASALTQRPNKKK